MEAMLLWKPIIVHWNQYRKTTVSCTKEIGSSFTTSKCLSPNSQIQTGVELYIAEALSRVALPQDKDDNASAEIQQFYAEVVSVNMVEILPISGAKIQEIRVTTAEDAVLQELAHVVMTGWPDSKSDVPPQIIPYFRFADEITMQDGLLLRGTQVPSHRNTWKDTRTTS